MASASGWTRVGFTPVTSIDLVTLAGYDPNEYFGDHRALTAEGLGPNILVVRLRPTSDAEREGHGSSADEEE